MGTLHKDLSTSELVCVVEKTRTGVASLCDSSVRIKEKPFIVGICKSTKNKS